jgi:hypothetical protein
MNVRIARDGVEIGECDWDDLEQLLNEGQVLTTDHFWYEGMEDWRLLNDLLAFEESETKPAETLPDYIGWDAGEPATTPSAFRLPSIRAVAIGCAVAAAIAIVLYLIGVFSDRRPDMPIPSGARTADLARTDTALRAKATTELIARLDKLPTVASPPSYTFYNDVSIASSDPSAPLTVRIRGWESLVDPATRQITSQTNFVLEADFRDGRWFFKHYNASTNDLVHGTRTEIAKGARAPVPPAIVSLLGIEVKSD